eukprot:2249954-Amphidinium_carterae.1
MLNRLPVLASNASPPSMGPSTVWRKTVRSHFHGAQVGPSDSEKHNEKPPRLDGLAPCRHLCVCRCALFECWVLKDVHCGDCIIRVVIAQERGITQQLCVETSASGSLEQESCGHLS